VAADGDRACFSLTFWTVWVWWPLAWSIIPPCMHYVAGLYKPRTGHTGRTGGCMNHSPAILAAPALIYSTHRLLVVWIIATHFHFCSLLDRYTILEVWAVRRPMRVCCGSRWGRCVLSINIWDSLTAPCLVYNTAMYAVYGRCGQYGQCIFIHWPVHGLYGPPISIAQPISIQSKIDCNYV